MFQINPQNKKFVNLRDFLKNVQIPRPSHQTKELRQTLEYCDVAHELCADFKRRRELTHPKKLEYANFISDIDLTNQVISEQDSLHRLWCAQQIIQRKISTFQSVGAPILGSFLRKQPDIQQDVFQNSLSLYQGGQYREAIELLERSSEGKIASVIKSLVPFHIGQVDQRSHCLLDFMYTPTFGRGNPRWLMTTQILTEVIANDNSWEILNWLLGKPKSIETRINEQNWYPYLLSIIRYELHYKTFKGILTFKERNPELTYYGQNLDQAIDGVGQYPDYRAIFQKIFPEQQNPSFYEIAMSNDSLKYHWSPQIGARIIQIMLIEQCDNTQILQKIEQMVDHQFNLEQINLEIQQRYYYEWSVLAETLDHEQAQRIIQKSVCQIIGMINENDNTEGTINLLVNLLKRVNDQEFKLQKLSSIFAQMPNISIIANYFNDLNFNEEDKARTVKRLLEEIRYTQDRCSQAIDLIRKVFSKEDEKFLPLKLIILYDLLKHILSRYSPDNKHQGQLRYILKPILQMIEDLCSRYDQQIGDHGVVGQRLTGLIYSYFSMKDNKKFEDITQTVISLFQINSQDQEILKIQEFWTYKLLKRAAKLARQSIDPNDNLQLLGLFNKLLAENYLDNVCNLQELLSYIPLEEDTQLLQYIFR